MSTHELIHVGHVLMDATHDELAELLASVHHYHSVDELDVLLDALIAHTETHFETEELWMEQTGFAHIREHKSEHRQLLGEMKMMRRRLRPLTIKLVRSFIDERLPDWLQMHLQRMDSLLASHLNHHSGH